MPYFAKGSDMGYVCGYTYNTCTQRDARRETLITAAAVAQFRVRNKYASAVAAATAAGVTRGPRVTARGCVYVCIDTARERYCLPSGRFALSVRPSVYPRWRLKEFF